MKTFTNISAIALLAIVGVNSTAMAAPAPKVKAVANTVTNASYINSSSVNVLDNDTFSGVTIKNIKATKADSGKVTCTVGGDCTYTPTKKAAGERSDDFKYTVTYTFKDAKGRTITRTISANVIVRFDPNSISK